MRESEEVEYIARCENFVKKEEKKHLVLLLDVVYVCELNEGKDRL